jgi:hypothetical protein
MLQSHNNPIFDCNHDGHLDDVDGELMTMTTMLPFSYHRYLKHPILSWGDYYGELVVSA